MSSGLLLDITLLSFLLTLKIFLIIVQFAHFKLHFDETIIVQKLQQQSLHSFDSKSKTIAELKTKLVKNICSLLCFSNIIVYTLSHELPKHFSLRILGRAASF